MPGGGHCSFDYWSAPTSSFQGHKLAEDLWDGEPTSGAASTLQSHVSLLRQLLGPSRLKGGGGGYQLMVAEGELDVHLFEDEFRQGCDALAAADPAAASALLSTALGRWRGAALADVSGASWALPEQTRLEELRAGAIETWLEARLELGEHQEVVALAEAAVAEHPLREAVWGSLMLALYRSGRQSDSLRAYQRLRTLLGEELGIEPSTQLVALDDAIVHQRAELDWSGPGLPSGEAWRWHRAAPAEPRAGDIVKIVREDNGEVGTGVIPLPGRLAARPEVGVVGRHDELTTVAEAFKRVAGGGYREVLLVSGEAGLGKTTLICEAARAAYEAGACVMLGHCEEDLATPYQLFAEAVTHYVTHAPEASLLAHVDAQGSELPRASIPALGRRLSGLPPSKATDADTGRFSALRCNGELVVYGVRASSPLCWS